MMPVMQLHVCGARALEVCLRVTRQPLTQADNWGNLWSERGEYIAFVRDDDCPPPLPLLASELDVAASSFAAATGLGTDNIAPRAVARLSASLQCELCELLLAAESIGKWPAIWHLVLIVLIPKSDGTRRPIGLFPAMVRICMCVCAPS
jgi:hypothetical protein